MYKGEPRGDKPQDKKLSSRGAARDGFTALAVTAYRWSTRIDGLTAMPVAMPGGYGGMPSEAGA